MITNTRDNLGHIYVMTNPGMPNLVKVGFTNKGSVADRADELHTTGVPYPFTIEWSGYVSDSKKAEQVAHNSLEEYKIVTDRPREFFTLDSYKACKIIIPAIIAANIDIIGHSGKLSDRAEAIINNYQKKLSKHFQKIDKVTVALEQDKSKSNYTMVSLYIYRHLREVREELGNFGHMTISKYYDEIISNYGL